MKKRPGNDIVGFVEHDHAACVTLGLRSAEAHCARRHLRLTAVRRRVLEILLESHCAMGAYDVLARLDREGFGSKPPLAYRALGFLAEHGFAHRVERLNAWIACAFPESRHDPAFMICTDCGVVAEATASATEGRLGRNARDAGFRIERTVLEAEGLCAGCQSQQAAQEVHPSAGTPP